MGNKKIQPTMTWEEAPDTVDHIIVSKILGCSEQTATKYFHEKEFPLLDKIGLKADKEAARLFFQGIKIKENPKMNLDYLMLQEIRKLNKNFEKYFEENQIKVVDSFAG